MWADVLHYFGKDVYKMDGGEAIMLAERVFDVMDYKPDGEPRSSIWAWYQANPPVEATQEEDLIDDRLAEMLEDAQDDDAIDAQLLKWGVG